MRNRKLFRPFCSLVTTVLFLLSPAAGFRLQAGGPVLVGGPSLGVEGKPFVWSTSGPVSYRVDGGPMASGTRTITNPEGITRVQQMFQVWADVQTASITFSNAGPLLSVGAFNDGDVNTEAEFNAVAGDCQRQTAVIFDADGSLFQALQEDPNVIGFATICALNPVTGTVVGGLAALNGKFQNGGGDDLTDAEFNGAFIHEFGHMIGLDHTQVNDNCRTGNCSGTDDVFGLPTMYPLLIGGLAEAGTSYPVTLSPDDAAWVSLLYPETVNDPANGKVPFLSAYGFIEGVVRFSDGISHAQGVNVIARREDNPATPEDESRREAVSMVSGVFFTTNPGQSVTGTNTAGGELGDHSDPTLVGRFNIPVLSGSYTLEVEPVFAGFTDGSSVNPFDPPIPLPGGVSEFYSGAGESNADAPRTAPTDTAFVVVSAGLTTGNVDIILNGTDARFDAFESSRLEPLYYWRPALPPWLRDDRWQIAGPRPGETA